MAIKLLFFSIAFFALLKSSDTLQLLEQKYRNKTPSFWGEKHKNIISKIHTQESIIFLTLDACSGKYDKRIIEFLQQEKIPAMIFVTTKWLQSHTQELFDISQDSLFSIQNHGNSHKPLSSDGKGIYHIQGTKNIQEIYEEITITSQNIQQLIGKKPKFFRSGTAYYDDIALDIAKDLGYQIIGFDVIGDAGATFSKEQILHQAKKVRNGSILIFHLNHPKSQTYEGLKSLIPLLKNQGFVFKNLQDYL